VTPDDALAVACDRCVTAATLLAGARALDGTDEQLALVLANSSVSGWSDHATKGSADPYGITVYERNRSEAVHVGWRQVASVIRRGMSEPRLVERLVETYERYVATATDPSISGRLATQVASAELAQVRRLVIEDGFAATPVQQTLFRLPPCRGRGLA